MAKNDKRDPKPNPNFIDQEAQSEADARVSRRRALIAGLVAAPAVLSLMNRSAWGGQVSCTLVASYVNAGYKWQSPGPSNQNITIGTDDLNRCGYHGG
ncbi:MAG: hypothetical protein ACM3TN_01160 [Alphaproteobacteria bacterium]